MSVKMKGLLKGLRYISQIFDEEEEEPELQIGFPTDVKHVAHIGWDGPTTNAPSWINSFKGEGDSATAAATTNVDQQNVPRARESRLRVQEKRVSTGSESPLESPSRRRSDKPKGSRRESSAGSSVDSPRKSSTSEQSRIKQVTPGLDSPARDSTSSSKPSRRKKSKASSSSSSKTSSSSKSKATGQSADSLPGSDPGRGGAQTGSTAAS